MENLQYVIGTDTESEDVKVYCVINIANGFIAELNSVRDNEDKFWQEVEKAKEFYNAKSIKNFINPSLKYLETLPKAYKIYEKLFGEPKTHAEWAERLIKWEK